MEPRLPSDVQVAQMETSRAQRLHQTLTAYYTLHCPENLSNVEALVARVVGGPASSVGGVVVGGVLWTEAELYEKVEAKYGVPVTVASGSETTTVIEVTVNSDHDAEEKRLTVDPGRRGVHVRQPPGA